MPRMICSSSTPGAQISTLVSEAQASPSLSTPCSHRFLSAGAVDERGYWELPRRPLVVHSHCRLTSTAMFDHFYMLGQRSSSIYTGDFACCELNHEKARGGQILPTP
eukprot:6188362-Pleurochrysis_carterae.AAC.1